MAYTSASAYGQNLNAGRNPNNDYDWGFYKWPKGVPANLLGTATYKDIRVTVRKELVELFQLAFAVTDAMGYTIYTKNPNGSGEVWGPWSYENRAIGGTTTASNHSKGKAIDINAPRNPQSRIFSSDIPPSVINAWEKLGFYWGGRYTGAKFDTMHLEYCWSPSDVARHVDTAKVMLRNLTNGSKIEVGGVSISVPVPVVTAPTPAKDDGGWPLEPGFYFGPDQGGYSRNGTGNQAEKNFVAEFQSQLNSLGYNAGDCDGIFGAKTAQAAAAWQARNLGGPRNIQISRLCGSNDWFGIHEDFYRNRAVEPAPAFPGLLKRGSKGDGVKVLQRRLNAHLTNSGEAAIGVDGDFGPGTDKAVRWYQTCRHGNPFNLDVDGLVGPATWRSLWL